MRFAHWPELIVLLFLLLLGGPSLIATAHLMLVGKGGTITKMGRATRFWIGLSAPIEAWDYLLGGRREGR